MASLLNAKIIDGPSKFDLMLALFDRKSVNTRQVTFATENGRDLGQTLNAVINSVGVEDGSGESWILEGYFMSRLRGTMPPPPRHFKMYFHTGRRQGIITAIDE